LRIFVVVILASLWFSTAKAQTVTISAHEQPLNEVLISLRNSYGLAFSFDDARLARYRVTLSAQFDTPEEALNALLEDLPLAYKKSREVFVIFPAPAKKQTSQKVYNLWGQVQERATGETLPYTHVVINGQGVMADLNGQWAYKSSSDSVFQVQVSHLSYYIMDTILKADQAHILKLSPAVEKLEEVIITNRVVESFVYNEDEPATVRLNHNVTRFLPGSSDNSIFNLLRLQSGILAAAEQASELMIWGSYEGQSRMLFDGFMLFGLRNFNDNISSVNPFMVKHVKLMKAGFDASFGNCVGGIAQITGKDGNTQNMALDMSVNNYTLNSMVSVPLTDYSAVTLGFRHTYYDLYKTKEVSIRNQNNLAGEEIAIHPDYRFRDLNFKFSSQAPGKTGVKLSILAGEDDFAFEAREEIAHRDWYRKTSENNVQRGASLQLNKTWKSALVGNMSVAWSDLQTRLDNTTEVRFINSGNLIRETVRSVTNASSEYTFKGGLELPLSEIHRLEGSLAFTGNGSGWQEDSLQVTLVDEQIQGQHFTFMLQDQLQWEHTQLKLGLRWNYVPELANTYWEPRASVTQELGNYVTAKLGYGLYRQFVMKSSVLDDLGNYHYMWVVADEESYPVLKGTHWVGGLVMETPHTHISIEPFYKKTSGITRYVNHVFRNKETLYRGEGRSYGLDLYVKQDIARHTAWVSYTLSKTEELFAYFPNDEFAPAPQDQRHELKLAAILDFDPFFFSANYVYGSGFPIPEFANGTVTYSRTPYHRVDAAFVYKFNGKHVGGEAGISVLNVFDTDNMLYNNLERVPSSQSASIELYSESMPFTPTLYLKVAF
jgi:hypothetical protein